MRKKLVYGEEVLCVISWYLEKKVVSEEEVGIRGKICNVY
jgi:hypothetical protein